jgi:hypothetical protein
LHRQVHVKANQVDFDFFDSCVCGFRSWYSSEGLGMRVICEFCGKEIDKKTGHVNRAVKLGLKMYCGRMCFGLNKRTTKEEKKKLKVEYDKKRRFELKDILKDKQKAYNESPAGRAMQKRHREKCKDYQKAYIKSEKYRKWKQVYDKDFHAKNKYGEFWEAAIILNDIENLLLPQRREVKVQKGTYNKSNQRKRHGTYRQKSQGITLGNPSRSENW